MPLVAGVLFSIAAAAGAFGHHVCGMLLRRTSARRVITTTIGLAHWDVMYLVAGARGCCLVATPIFGHCDRRCDNRGLHGGERGHAGSARGAGFGFLTTASLAGLAFSPIVSGILGATSIRAVFFLDTLALRRSGRHGRADDDATALTAAAAPATDEI